MQTDLAAPHDALSHLPVAAFYRELDVAFPGSRFILTTREEEGWLASCRNHFDPSAFQPNAVVRSLVERVYGVAAFEERSFRDALRRHDAGARDYFAQRPHDLLVLDTAAQDKWAPLTKFLGLAMPSEPYPHENRASRAPTPLKKAVRWIRKRLRRK